VRNKFHFVYKTKENICITVFILCPRDLLRSYDCVREWFDLKRLCLSFRWIEHNDRWDKLKSRAIRNHVDYVAHSYF